MTPSLALPTEPLAQALAPLRGRWLLLQQQFNLRQPRERLLMILVAVALGLALADSLWLGPALKRHAAARERLAQAQQTQAELMRDLQQMGTLANTQGQLRRAELAAWRERARAGEALLRHHEDSLVGPDQMLALLDEVLARHGQVQVRSMRTLERTDLLAAPGAPGQATVPPPTPTAATLPSAHATASAPATGPGTVATVVSLGGTGAGAAPATGPAATAAASAPMPAPSLYRHGVELVLEGSFNDLLAYLQALEALPQRLLWGGLDMKVQQHPKVQLTLQLYTVSRDRHWLEF